MQKKPSIAETSFKTPEEAARAAEISNGVVLVAKENNKFYVEGIFHNIRAAALYLTELEKPIETEILTADANPAVTSFDDFFANVKTILETKSNIPTDNDSFIHKTLNDAKTNPIALERLNSLQTPESLRNAINLLIKSYLPRKTSLAA